MTAEAPNFYAKTQNLINSQQLDLSAATLKVLLLTDAHTPDFQAHEFLDDVDTEELDVLGYTTGFDSASHQATALTWGLNDDGDAAFQFSGPVTFASLGGDGSEEVVRYLVVYIVNNDAADSRLVSIIPVTASQTDGRDKAYVFGRLTQGGTGSYILCPAA